MGYFWPTMKTEAALLQQKCQTCQEFLDKFEAAVIEDQLDWRQPYISYLQQGILPQDAQVAAALRKRAHRFIIYEGQLFRRGYNGNPLRCIAGQEIREVLHAAHEPAHIGGAKLYTHLVNLGYYWPTMEADSLQHVKKCKPCQFHGNLVHAPSVSLQALATPYPFHTWAFDLIGKIHPQSQQHIWILVATELFTKWAEAVPLRKATGTVVSQFILEHIICRFGIPKEIISDNGTPFVNKEMVALTTKYGINHKRSTVAYPQGNGQAEATNKTLLAILTKMRDDYPTNWHEQIPEVLWAYRTTARKPTGYSPFALVYGAEAVLPVELAVPSVRMSAQQENLEEIRLSQIEAIDELRDKAQKHFETYTQQQIKAYEGKVRRREFKEGDLVLKTATHIIRGVSANKFAAKWEGPFIIRTVSPSGYCTLSLINSEDKFWVNCKWLKHYYV